MIVTLYKTNCLAPTLTIPSVETLVEQCLQGDRSAYRMLYERYNRAMFNTALRITGNRSDAEDVLQDSFCDAYQQLGSLEHRMTFGAWLKQIVVFKSISLLKKKKIVFTDIDQQADHFAEENPSDEAETTLTVDLIKSAIQQLPDGFRAVITLYLLEGYDHEEIADILQVARSTVRTQYIRGKQKLLQLLKKENVHE